MRGKNRCHDGFQPKLFFYFHLLTFKISWILSYFYFHCLIFRCAITLKLTITKSQFVYIVRFFLAQKTFIIIIIDSFLFLLWSFSFSFLSLFVNDNSWIWGRIMKYIATFKYNGINDVFNSHLMHRYVESIEYCNQIFRPAYTMIFLNGTVWICSICVYHREVIYIASESPWKAVHVIFFLFW